MLPFLKLVNNQDFHEENTKEKHVKHFLDLNILPKKSTSVSKLTEIDKLSQVTSQFSL